MEKLKTLSELLSGVSSMEATPPKDRVEFKTYETSAAIIERTAWKIQLPISWSTSTDESAIKFIKHPSQRDKRMLLMNNRFRILLVEYDEPVDQPISNSVLYKQESVLNAARANGWIGERFDEFTKSNTAGSAFLDTPDGIGFIAQSPRDDGFPFFAISLTQRFTEAYQYDADWESLVFVRPSELWDDHAEPMLGRDPFPHDYPDSFQPDFMILPVVLLRCQVEHITEELSKIKKKLVEQDLDLTTKKVKDLKMMKHSLFGLQRTHFFLHRRWAFASELVENLAEAFAIIARRQSSEDETYEYSLTLRTRVASQQAILKSVSHDLDTTASRIESQQQFVSSWNRVPILSGLSSYNSLLNRRRMTK